MNRTFLTPALFLLALFLLGCQESAPTPMPTSPAISAAARAPTPTSVSNPEPLPVAIVPTEDAAAVREYAAWCFQDNRSAAEQAEQAANGSQAESRTWGEEVDKLEGRLAVWEDLGVPGELQELHDARIHRLRAVILLYSEVEQSAEFLSESGITLARTHPTVQSAIDSLIDLSLKLPESTYATLTEHGCIWMPRSGHERVEKRRFVDARLASSTPIPFPSPLPKGSQAFLFATPVTLREPTPLTLQEYGERCGTDEHNFTAVMGNLNVVGGPKTWGEVAELTREQLISTAYALPQDEIFGFHMSRMELMQVRYGYADRQDPAAIFDAEARRLLRDATGIYRDLVTVNGNDLPRRERDILLLAGCRW